MARERYDMTSMTRVFVKLLAALWRMEKVSYFAP
jgi:hypothetical protein